MAARSTASDSRDTPRSRGVVPTQGPWEDDRALVAGLRANQPGAHDALFQRYGKQVERIITHVIGFDRELSDILHEVFVQALHSLHTLQDARSLGTWLSRIATFTARKVVRSRARRSWLRLFTNADDEARWEPESADADPDTLHALRSVYSLLSKLPVDERVTFALRFIEGMSVTEVAGATGVSPTTAKRRLRRAEHRFLVGARSRPELEAWLRGSPRWQVL